ncbi:MAG: hypothetical protein H7Y27_07965 [Gemmatimonadaceae bacterium]|nr:hypothetical protein [Chitinophagaceae bacterium]
MKKLLLPVVVLLVLVGCDKDKFQTKPQITIKDYTEVVPRQGQLEIRLEFTDKEGDLSEGSFVYIPVRLNQKPLPAGVEYDSIKSVIPKFPNNDKGDFFLKLPHIFLLKSPTENDTLVFRMVVVDRAGNKSDTVSSDKIIILQ